MQLSIISDGQHEPGGHHFMVVDRAGVLLDLSGVQGTLHDPTVTRIEWGLVRDGTEIREGGTITMQDGSQRPTFFDKTLLKPYLDTWTAKMAANAAAQAAFNA